MWFSDGTEADLVDALRVAGDLALSLVAIDQIGKVIGHIGFSPVTVDGADCGWLQMAPVSVAPDLQHKGIGSALIRAGVAALHERRARGIAVVGNPDYYERFGFALSPGLAPLAEHDAEYFRALVLAGELPCGVLRYAAAFG